MPSELETVEYEVSERIISIGQTSGKDDYVALMTKYEIAFSGYLWLRRFRDFVSKTLSQKTKYRYFVYSRHRDCKKLENVIPRAHTTANYAALVGDTDIVAAKMVMNFDIIYDATDGGILFIDPNNT